MEVAFIGLGIMGQGMAANLLREGVPLWVYNRTPAKAEDLLAQGARWAARPRDIGDVGLTFTMLAHPQAVRAMALETGGFLDAMAPGSLWIDCSTVNPAFSREMAGEAAARQVRFVDAPVAGTKPQAEQAELTIFAGGNAADVAESKPYLEMIGRRVIHVGEQGMGSSLKMVVNTLLASALATFSESVALGRALGLSQEMLFEVLIGGAVTAPVVTAKREKIENDDYAAHFPLKWMLKDMQLVSTAAQNAETFMPLASATRRAYAEALQEGMGDLDFAAIFRYFNRER